MLPSSYQACLQAQLTSIQFMTLKMLVALLQRERQVSIERLATLFAQPIQFESRRRNIQRLLQLPQLNIKALWFPILKYWLKHQFHRGQKASKTSLFLLGLRVMSLIQAALYLLCHPMRQRRAEAIGLPATRAPQRDAIEIQYSLNGEDYQMLRLAYLPRAEAVQVGLNPHSTGFKPAGSTSGKQPLRSGDCVGVPRLN